MRWAMVAHVIHLDLNVRRQAILEVMPLFVGPIHDAKSQATENDSEHCKKGTEDAEDDGSADLEV